MFVDSTGRRRRAFALIGAGGAVTLIVAVAVLMAGFFGPGSGRLPGLPELLQGPAASPSSVPSPTPERTTTRPTSANTVPTGPAPLTTGPSRGGNRPTDAPSHPAPSKKRQ